MNGGAEISLEKIQEKILSYVPPVTGVTFSGGDPVYQAKEVEALALWCKNRGLQTTLYTGFELDELWDLHLINLSLFDYVVDGLFKKEYKSCEAPFRGSSNQKMWKQTANGQFEEVMF